LGESLYMFRTTLASDGRSTWMFLIHDCLLIQCIRSQDYKGHRVCPLVLSI